MNTGIAITNKYHDLRRSCAGLEEMALSNKQEVESTRAQAEAMQRRVAQLEKAEKSLEKWKKKEPAISHYLGIVTEMAKYVSMDHHHNGC